jgi:hypothetical protein
MKGAGMLNSRRPLSARNVVSCPTPQSALYMSVGQRSSENRSEPKIHDGNLLRLFDLIDRRLSRSPMNLMLENALKKRQ